MSRAGLRFWSAVLAVAVFLVDVLTPLEGAVAVLYVVAILLAAKTNRRDDTIVAAAGCVVLTIVAYLLSHDLESIASPAVRMLVSLAAIGITTLLALQNHAATKRLAAQARLLNLSHDMIFVRDRGGVITFWNKTAEQAYGWSTDEAVGQLADKLLRTTYPDRRETIETGLLDTGRWEGRVKQRTKDGAVLTVDARWALQHDRLGKPVGVLETHTDVTDRVAAHSALVQSEQRYRRMFDASRIGVVEEDWREVRIALQSLDTAGAGLRDHLAQHPDFVRQARRLAGITDVNPALQAMAGADGVSAFIENVERLLGADDRSFLGALIAFAEGEPFYEGETELVSLDGRKVPVLFTITFPTGPDGDRNVLAFVVDITERKQAQDALLAAQAELAHAARLATLGELTASIAHEVNQPLAAIVTSGEAGLRWLRRDVPDLDEVAATIGHVVARRPPRQRDRHPHPRLPEEGSGPAGPACDRRDRRGSIAPRRARARAATTSSSRVETAHGLAASSRRPDRASAGPGESPDQCRPGHVGPAAGLALSWCAPAPSTRDSLAIAVQDSGPGIRAGRPAAPVRSVLHDQAGEWAWDLRSVGRPWKLTAASCRPRARPARGRHSA